MVTVSFMVTATPARDYSPLKLVKVSFLVTALVAVSFVVTDSDTYT